MAYIVIAFALAIPDTAPNISGDERLDPSARADGERRGPGRVGGRRRRGLGGTARSGAFGSARVLGIITY